MEALLVVDVQNDFCTGGALAVPGGEAVVPGINRLWDGYACKVLTQDWHPPGHASFASSHEGKQPFDTGRLDYGEQVLWPDHCVQGTPGAAFHPDLRTDGADLVLRKGFRPGIDSYSAFFENDRTDADRARRLSARARRRAGRADGPRDRFLRRLLGARRADGRLRDGGAGRPLPGHRHGRLARPDAGRYPRRRRAHRAQPCLTHCQSPAASQSERERRRAKREDTCAR